MNEASRQETKKAQYVGDRRYRLNGDEIPIVLELVRLKLLELVKAKEDLDTAGILFRVLYRHQSYTPGRPTYPEPLEWLTIEAFLRDIEPLIDEEGNGPFSEEGETLDSQGHAEGEVN